VKSSRMRRLVGVTSAAMLTLAALGAVPASAATPNWNVTFKSLPAAVKAGNDAGWEVTVWNDGASQINALQATIRVEGDGQPLWWSSMPKSVDGEPTGDNAACSPTSSSLVCQLGTMVDDASATITVAFNAPASAGDKITIFVDLLAGTGDTTSDGPGKSRGDDDTFDWTTNIVVNSNYDGGFVVGNDEDDDTYATTGDLRRQNKQNSTVVVDDEHLPVTVEDGPTVTGQCGTVDCGEVIGEWTKIDVPNHSGMIHVTMFVYGGAVPGGVSADEIYVIHDPDEGATYTLNQVDDACPTSGTPTEECVKVTKTGNNWKIDVSLEDTGTLRGGF
jgi:hypothetical protein